MGQSNSTDGVGLSALGIGSVFIFAGIKGYSVLAVIQNLVTGKPILTDVTSVTPLTTSDSTTGGISSPVGDAVGTNQEIAKMLAASYGWDSGAEWEALVLLWQQESSWNNHANNTSSGAYGIPQALPYTKMPKAAQPESAGGSSDANAQIKWGLDYIKGRYGSPVMAEAHEKANGWY